MSILASTLISLCTSTLNNIIIDSLFSKKSSLTKELKKVEKEWCRKLPSELDVPLDALFSMADMNSAATHKLVEELSLEKIPEKEVWFNFLVSNFKIVKKKYAPF